MNIALAADDNYAKYLHISIVSILRSNKKEEIMFYIIDHGISGQNRQRIMCSVKAYGKDIKFIEASDLMQDAQVDDTFPAASYSRLFLPKIREIDKVIYFDCDSLIKGCLDKLWNFKLEGCCLAGVYDPVIDYYKTAIGLRRDAVYINAGVLLMDLKAMRSSGWTKKVQKMIKDYHGSIPHHDQGIINALGKNKVCLLPPEYNVMDVYFFYSKKQMERLTHAEVPYTEDEIKAAVDHPVFIHYTAGLYGRAWNVRCRHPRKMEYRKAAAEAGYHKTEILENRPENKHALFMQSVYRKLPFFLYCLIYDAINCRKKIIRKVTAHE